MQTLGYTLAFIVEIVVFGLFALSGFALKVPLPFQIIISFLAFSILIVFWSLYMSPKATRKLGTVRYYTAKLCIYSIATIILSIVSIQLMTLFIAGALLCELLLINHNKTRLS